MELKSVELLKNIIDKGFNVEFSTVYQRIHHSQYIFLHWDDTDQWQIVDRDGLAEIVDADFVAKHFGISLAS